MKYYFTFLLVWFFSGSYAQNFPTDYLGHWSGTLQWYDGLNHRMNISMQLDIQKTDSAGQYTWIMTYGDSGKDVRNYKLVARDSAKGWWVVDEGDGILIDMFVTGEHVSTVFEVMGTFVMMQYTLNKGVMEISMLSWPLKSAMVSGKGTDEVPTVNSYKCTSWQTGYLLRRKE